MFDETIEEIKEFLKDAKSKGAMVSCGCKLFDSRYSYYDSDLNYHVNEEEMYIMGKMTMVINLADAIATFNYSDEGDALKIADAAGNTVIIEK